MPQAEQELRELMDMMFHNGGINDYEPYQFLKDRGYTEEAGMFKPPSKGHWETEKEILCLRFLKTEWDYDYDPP